MTSFYRDHLRYARIYIKYIIYVCAVHILFIYLSLSLFRCTYFLLFNGYKVARAPTDDNLDLISLKQCKWQIIQ